MSNAISIRPATPEDISQIRQFILELAIYEKAEHEVEADEEALLKTLFGEGLVSLCISLITQRGKDAMVSTLKICMFHQNHVAWVQGKRYCNT